MKRFAALLVGLALLAGACASDDSQPYTITVNYDLSIEEAVVAGDYDLVNPNINSANFPSTRGGTETIEVYLVHFGRVITSEEVLEEFDKQGLRPATIEELLAFGALYPDLQRQFPIVALGSVWGNQHVSPRVPILGSDERGRGAGIHWLGDRFSSSVHFLVVRK